MAARKRLVFDELLRIQLALVLRKRASSARPRASCTTLGGELVHRFHDAAAVPAHRRPASGRSPRSPPTWPRPIPMHRLLQGDVGAGKTVVAVTALLAAVAGRPPGRADGADRGAGRAARHRHPGAARRVHRARPTSDSLFGRSRRCGSSCSPTGSPAADGADVLAEAGRRARSTSPIGTHALIQEGCVPVARRRGDRRAAPLRRRAAGRAAARRPRRRRGARRAGDDGHADPPHGGHDRLRRSRRVGPRRAAARAARRS